MATLPSGLSDHVEDHEDLARILTSSSLFNARIVKPAAFIPNPRNGETSVFRHSGEPGEDLWQLARQYVLGDRTLHGAAMVKAHQVRAARLDVLASEPPPRHANIVGWPRQPTDPELEKAAQKERALQIAQHANLLRPYSRRTELT